MDVLPYPVGRDGTVASLGGEKGERRSSKKSSSTKKGKKKRSELPSPRLPLLFKEKMHLERRSVQESASTPKNHFHGGGEKETRGNGVWAWKGGKEEGPTGLQQGLSTTRGETNSQWNAFQRKRRKGGGASNSVAKKRVLTDF